MNLQCIRILYESGLRREESYINRQESGVIEGDLENDLVIRKGSHRPFSDILRFLRFGFADYFEIKGIQMSNICVIVDLDNWLGESEGHFALKPNLYDA